LGAGYLKIAVTSDGELAANAVEVGATSGMKLTYKQEMKPIECDQAMSPVTHIMIGEEGKLTIDIIEQSLRSLAIALGLKPSTGIYSQPTYQRISFGGKQDPLFCYLEYICPKTSNTAKNWRVKCLKAMPGNGLDLPFQKKEERKFSVEFNLLPESSSSEVLGYIEEEV